MFYNVVFVSTIQQSEPAVYIHISPLIWVKFPVLINHKDQSRNKWNRNEENNSKDQWKDKVDKSLGRLTEKKRERTQIKKIKNERKHTADTAEMQRMVRDYYN